MRNGFLILILGINISLAQTDNNHGRYIIKSNITQFLDAFSFPTLQFSVEHELNPYCSIGAELGYQIYNFNQPDTIFLKPKGFKANIEGRVYFSKLINQRPMNTFLEFSFFTEEMKGQN